MLIGICANLEVFISRILQYPLFLTVAWSIPGWGNPGFNFDLEICPDFQALYSWWTQNFVTGSWPYSLNPPMMYYPYPPLFILTLAVFFLLPGPHWLATIPLEAFNLGTGYLVYKLAITLTRDEQRAVWATLLYFLNPFTLIYGSYANLNPTPMTFFVVLAFYLVLQRKEGWAMVSLGIATMFKQPALIFFPLLAIAILKARSPAKFTAKFVNVFKSTGIYILTIFAISAPFLVVDARTYLYQVFLDPNQSGARFSLIPYWGLTVLPQVVWPNTLNGFLAWLGVSIWGPFPPPIAYQLVGPSSPVPLAYQTLMLGIGYGYSWYIFLGLCTVSICLKFLRLPSPANSSSDTNTKLNGNSHVKFFVSEALFAALVFVFCLQLFWPHGVYKYYLILLAPFMSLFYDYRNLNLGPAEPSDSSLLRWRYLLPLFLSWTVFWMDRYLYLLIILGWLIFLLIERQRSHPSPLQLEQMIFDGTRPESITQSA